MCAIRVAKTKALISFPVTAKLICVFVLAYAENRFSYDAAHMRNVLFIDLFSFLQITDNTLNYLGNFCHLLQALVSINFCHLLQALVSINFCHLLQTLVSINWCTPFF